MPMSELLQIAQNRLAEMAGQTLARLHVDAGGSVTDRRTIERIASALWSAGQSGQVCIPLTELPVENARDVLVQSPLVSQPSVGEVVRDDSPMVIQFDRLYPLRQWRAEYTIATGLLNLAKHSVPDGYANDIAASKAGEQDADQHAALVCALTRQLLVLSGGPGTGKTTTLGTIVRALAEQSGSLKIALTAPTGKATARLNAAIGTEHAVASTSTLHRLLGYQTGGRYTYGSDNPLPYDVIVVDECSMVDAMLGARLFLALPAHAKLILAGDKDQLSSVEPGAFFGSVCAVQALQLAQCTVILRKNYRQQDAPEIANWAGAVRDGELTGVMPETGQQVRRYATSDDDLLDGLIERAVRAYAPLVKRAATLTDEADQLALLGEFEQLRVLTAMRVGPFGVEAMNRRLSQAIQTQLLLPDSRWFAGRLIIVSQNAPTLNLFNGDVGLTTTDAQGQLSVLFNVNGEGRKLLPLQMPAHEDAFALTVHQAQGSDFAQVLLLPAPANHPLATRAGLYTGITRAREQIHVYAADGDLTWAAQNRAIHYGALTEHIESIAGDWN
jgi:exodeoxyribonuclease V alpha subunit